MFYRIVGYFIVISFVLAVIVTTVIESVKDVTYLYLLLGCYAVCGIFLFGIYLLLKSYEKKEEV